MVGSKKEVEEGPNNLGRDRRLHFLGSEEATEEEKFLGSSAAPVLL